MTRDVTADRPLIMMASVHWLHYVIVLEEKVDLHSSAGCRLLSAGLTVILLCETR